MLMTIVHGLRIKKRKPLFDNEKEELFMEWIHQKSNKYYENIQNEIQPRTLKLFKDVISVKGIFALSEYENI